jgi:internalin A
MAAEIVFQYENNGYRLYNDQVQPGQPFLVSGFVYDFDISPETNFWRVGFRFSENAEIPFFHPRKRYPPSIDSFLDLTIAAGRFDGKSWREANYLEISLQTSSGTESLTHTLDYIPGALIRIRFHYTRSNKILSAEITTENFDPLPLSCSLPVEFDYFKPFTWADKKAYKIMIKAIIKRFGERPIKNVEYFEVGQIGFRFGSIFDPTILAKPALVILPCSDEGTLSSELHDKVVEFGIPIPIADKKGIFVLTNNNSTDNLFVGYAYSVKNGSSSLKLVQKILKEIFASGNVSSYNKSGVAKVSLPLLGTGAGHLNMLEVASLYDRFFNSIKLEIEIIVSIPTKPAFASILERFTGRAIDISRKKEKFKPGFIAQIERRNRIQIPHDAYTISRQLDIVELSLSNINLDAQDLLKYCPNIKKLSLLECAIVNEDKLGKLKNIQELSLPGSQLSNFNFLPYLNKLSILDLSKTGLNSIGILVNLRKLKKLILSRNEIENVPFLGSAVMLEHLDLSNNRIKEISFITYADKLKFLNLANNQIHQLSISIRHNQLTLLDFRNNKIETIDILLKLRSLKIVYAEKNPFVDYLKISLKEGQNHLPAIKNAFSRNQESGKKMFERPVKILLLGNHATGKTSLLNYFFYGHLLSNTSSTHILTISNYPLNRAIPTAVFFDFGGQDYYHGIYRSFLSSQGIYLLFYNTSVNRNQQRSDSNNLVTQDFSLAYWLGQKQYLEEEKFGGLTDPLLLIQTRADEDQRSRFYTMHNEPKIHNEFFICLREGANSNKAIGYSNELNESALKYLSLTIRTLIDQAKRKNLEPEWFIEFYKFIFEKNVSASHVPMDVETAIMPHYKRNETELLELLKDDLDQLHQQGLVLYYRNVMPEKAWLNPKSFIKYVHETILSKENILNKNGIIPFDEFKDVDGSILNLLRLQKVIFLHDFGEFGREYIIPSFLPIANINDKTYGLLTFGIGAPSFTLKFLHFMPFGIINQLISVFGLENSRKKFWRDQLLFTLHDDARVLLRLDFQALEIKVAVDFRDGLLRKNKLEIQKYLFYVLMALYWDFPVMSFTEFVQYLNGNLPEEMLEVNSVLKNKVDDCINIFENEECRPLDLNVSIDDTFFISYRELGNQNDFVRITGKRRNQEGGLSDEVKSIPIFPFQIFVKKELKRRKKVVISYSKKDLKLVNKFKDHIKPLYDDNLIEQPWYCSELEVGTEWDEEISRRFEEADIIFFMISENLFSVQYVQDYEIKNAIDRYDRGETIMIIPILMSPYHFARQHPYNLARFSALPFTLRAVTLFSNQNMAWYSIQELVRIAINRSLDPGDCSEVLTSELKEIYEKIIGEKIEG